MSRITVSTKIPYDIIVERGTIKKLPEFIEESFPPPRKICVITDSNVGTLYAPDVIDSLNAAGYKTFRIIFPAGEHSKSLTTYANILESLAEEGLSRTDLLLGLGGGVTGDLTGFVAGTYMRGVNYINVPTTLLAAIDSSVGGKTGVNTLSGKNLAGIFWQPSMVITDPDVLDTLPENKLIDGIAEAVKAAVISDGSLIPHIQDRNYEYVMERCISIKKSLVEVDENDTGLRQLLNYGHTLAHGIEKMSAYSVSHGRAVAKGMVGEAKACFTLGYTRADISEELARVLSSCGFDPSMNYDPEELYRFSLMDKKIRDGMISIIVPEVIGKCTLKKISMDELKEFILAAIN